MDKVSFVGNADVDAIDHLYQMYVENPDSVDQGWQKFFEGFEFAKTDYSDGTGDVPENFKKEVQVLHLIEGYRTRGHLFTKTNPVRERRHYEPALDLENFGLSQADLGTIFQAGNEIGIGAATLQAIVNHLQSCYCDTTGAEFMYIRDPERRKWLQDRLEAKDKVPFSKEQKIDLLKELGKTVNFEGFLNKKFVGQKRFSIEGCEILIPALDMIIQEGSKVGNETFVFGMAHRGRLNTLTNIMQKRPQDILCEFEGKEFDIDETFDGDVKYHMGFSSKVKSKDGKELELILAPNPSHLESVGAVAMGIARSRVDLKYHNDCNKICNILIHGDAALAGQGITYEIVQMAHLKSNDIGGTIHIVTNNQVGFTTNYMDGRSSTYCTDLAKITMSPALHVNADDAEAVIRAIKLAVDYRHQFNQDIFIDMLGYRKYGHNEGDEPKFTQPNLYKAIAKHPNPKKIYLDRLVSEGVITVEEDKAMEQRYLDHLEVEYKISQEKEKAIVWKFLKDDWENYRRSTEADFDHSPETGVSKERLLELAKKITTLPEGKNYFRKIQKIIEARYDAITNNQLDWGCAEMLAYASILDEGKTVRLTGQDTERGTFSHRHAVVKTEDTEERVITLNQISDTQGEFSVYNSLLSEYAALGFEYGYSIANPKGLNLWEAQFGDFANGAQIMMDQYISAGEDKWSAQCGLVLLLPHGYEGQGSEHSSARLERYLQLASEYNMYVINPTTPANNFHALRRQLAHDFRKPLVVMSPKLLLRLPAATSPLEDLTKGGFQELIDDAKANKKEVDTVVMCSGKFYYDAIAKAEELNVTNMAFVRVEQLYPLPKKQIDEMLASYKKVKNVIWAQEEPENMGAWRYIAMELRAMNLIGVTRPASASPAEGSKKLHERRLAHLMENLFQYANVTV